MKRLGITVLLVLFGAMLSVLYVKQKKAYAEWQLVNCSVVKDDRVSEGQSVRLMLDGPTKIQVTEWSNQCDIPVGTVFGYRTGSTVCTGKHAETCFIIESEETR